MEKQPNKSPSGPEILSHTSQSSVKTEALSKQERETFQKRQKELLIWRQNEKKELDFRYRLQDTHMIVPASSMKMLGKAIEQGCGGAKELLERSQITLSEVAKKLALEPGQLEKMIEERPHADLVLVDGEDATALKDHIIEEARQNAVEIFTKGKWGSSLRFYRPSGLELSFCQDDLTTVLFGVEQGSYDRYPIDGIIFPKVDHPEEIEWVCDLLSLIEQKIGLSENTISLQFLVESAWSIENLEALCRRAKERLSGIIFGLADYGSEMGISTIDNNHPLFDQARLKMINTAAAFGVAAVDAMTFRYPVGDKNLSPQENKTGILERLDDVYRDALHASDLGMAGKWVGHPLQLMAAKAAFEQGFDAADLEEKARYVESYAEAVADEKGATMIGGQMADRATDRQVRNYLKKAILKGKFSKERGEELGL